MPRGDGTGPFGTFRNCMPFDAQGNPEAYGGRFYGRPFGRGRGFRFRYSYDAKLSSPELHIPNMGAHEISMAIVFENLHNTRKKRAIKSPKI